MAQRMGIAQSRAWRLEGAELTGSIRLGGLSRAAEALDCRLVYAFVPDESLEKIVWRQARRKAVAALNASLPEQLECEDKRLMAEVMSEYLTTLVDGFVDHPRLWR
jgi:predicted DNA-binding mobile mystery protein A